MHYSESAPPAVLSRHVRCIWELRAPADPSDPSGTPESIVPDGCPELVINRADRFCQVHADGTRELQPTILIAGQMSRPLTIASTGVVDLIGIRFEPGGLFTLLRGLPQTDLNEQRIDLEAISPGLYRELREAARSRHSMQRVIRVLVRHLERRTSSYGRLVDEGVRRIVDADGDLRIEDLGRGLGASHRKVQRAFQREVGISPKLLARIVRFQRVFAAIEAGLDWTSLALDCGYYDQAHLIRDFGRFAGKSPASYFQEAHPLSDLFTGGA